jgi:hypothetical protein
MEKGYFENSVMSTEISRFLFYGSPGNNLRETGSIKWRKNKMISLGGLPKMAIMASE